MSLLDYYFFGVMLGIRTLLRGGVTLGLKTTLSPIGYWRCVEIPWALAALSPSRGKTILDIGSPKLPSIFIAKKQHAIVYATDIWNYFITTYTFFSELSGITVSQGFDSKNSSSQIIFEIQDGRNLSYPDCSFDKVYSISVLEHIAEDGDQATMLEIARVLKPGGKAIVTVPFAPKYENVYVKRDVFGRKVGDKKELFFERYYDSETLRKRLIDPSGLNLLELTFFTEPRFQYFQKIYSKLPRRIKLIISLLNPLMAGLFIRQVDELEAKRLYTMACFILQRPN